MEERREEGGQSWSSGREKRGRTVDMVERREVGE